MSENQKPTMEPALHYPAKRSLTDPRLDLKLHINETFFSLQGEAGHAGAPCFFIRLGGCALRCTYCDTKYAYEQWDDRSVRELLYQCEEHAPSRLVQITGGEPLEQPDSIALMEVFVERNYEVLLETGGHCSLAKVPPQVVKILDFKTPSSGECHRNLYDNLSYLDSKDQIKFVVGDEHDFKWSMDLIREELSLFPGIIWMSPVTPGLHPRKLAEWILKEKLPVRLQTQLHKMLWKSKRGH